MSDFLGSFAKGMSCIVKHVPPMLISKLPYGTKEGLTFTLNPYISTALLSLAVGYPAYQLCKSAYRKVLPDTTPFAETYGGWALVTGCSSGMGADFARQLAASGMHIVLAARRVDRLMALAAELRDEYKVQTKVVQADLSTSEGVRSLADAVKDIDIGVLVNNAGVGYGGRFAKQDLERIENMMSVNVIAPTILSRLLLPSLKERTEGKQNLRSAIIMVSSVSALQPLPYHGAYAASKAFLSFLGLALWEEERESGVDVICVEPASVETEFQEHASQAAHHGAKSEDVVTDALDCLRYRRGPATTYGFLTSIKHLFASIAPRTVILPICRRAVMKWAPQDLK